MLDGKQDSIYKVNQLGPYFKNIATLMKTQNQEVVLWMVDQTLKQTDFFTFAKVLVKIVETLLRILGVGDVNFLRRINALGPAPVLDLFAVVGENPVEKSQRRGFEEILEEGRIDLRAAVVVRADVVQIRAVGQGVLGDDIDIAPVEFGIAALLGRDEAFAEDHVGRTKPSRIGAPIEHRALRHFGVQIEGRCEHVVT